MTTDLILNNLLILGTIFAGAFVVLGAVDGIYFHLIKYKLHIYNESRLEHLIHSARGVLLSIIGFLIFSENASESSRKLSILVAVLIVFLDLALEVVDIYVEKDSRKNLGGVSSSEMVLHVFASSFRMAALVCLMIVGYQTGFSTNVSTIGVIVAVVAMIVGLVGIFQGVISRPRFFLKMGLFNH